VARLATPGSRGPDAHAVAAQAALQAWRRALRSARRQPGDRKVVHQFRVATRRLLAISQALAPADAQLQARFERRMRSAFRAAGEVRDAQVCGEWFGRLCARHPVAAEAREAIEAVHRQRGKRLRKRVERVPASKVRRDWRRLHEPLQQGAHERDARYATAARRLRASRVRLGRLAARAARSMRAEDLHRLRIALKEVRYALEWLGPRSGDAHWRRSLARLVRLQAQLGRINDGRAMLAWLTRLPRLTGRPLGDFTRLETHLNGLQRRRLVTLRHHLMRPFAAESIARSARPRQASRRGVPA
jgi:CHAD domain-containing protein